MATKLLLIADVDDLGRSGDIVSVKPGYARNYLLPMGFGIIADKNAQRMQTRLQEERKAKAIEERKESEAIAQKLSGVRLATTVKVDHEGHMYGSVSVADIIHMLNEQAGIALEKKSISLKHPIKTTGTHKIHVKLKEEISADIELEVNSDSAVAIAPQAAPEAQ